MELENMYNSVGNSYYDPLEEIKESNSEIFINENKIEFEDILYRKWKDYSQ